MGQATGRAAQLIRELNLRTNNYVNTGRPQERTALGGIIARANEWWVANRNDPQRRAVQDNIRHAATIYQRGPQAARARSGGARVAAASGANASGKGQYIPSGAPRGTAAQAAARTPSGGGSGGWFSKLVGGSSGGGGRAPASGGRAPASGGRAPASGGRAPSGSAGAGAGAELDLPGGDILDAPVGLFGAITRTITGQLPSGGFGLLWNNPATSFFRRPLVQLGLVTVILPGIIGLGFYAYNQGKKPAPKRRASAKTRPGFME